MKIRGPKKSWYRIPLSLLVILYVSNWIFMPSIVGITKLEEFFRPKSKTRFNASEWKSFSPSTGERYKMVDDLLETEMLLGLNKKEVTELLGNPEIETSVDGEQELHYTLGSQSTLPSRSLIFLGRLENLELWTLRIRIRTGHVREALVKVD